MPLMATSTRLRKSPFYEKTLEYGCSEFTVYNRMLMPLAFAGGQVEYSALTERVAIWDVGAERQVELSGPDAGKLAQLLTCRDISGMKDGTCRYAVMCDSDGVVLNDPVLLKLSDETYWFSLADSDALLWCKAHAQARKLNVKVSEPDVSPLALQGPQSRALVRDVFGIDDIKYFHFKEVMLHDEIPCLVARSGWSPEHGYEVYLKDGAYGDRLWEIIWQAGQKFGIAPGAPNQSRRIEAGLFSFGGDSLPDTNALELGLPTRFVDPFKEHDFIGKEALQRIALQGTRRQLVGIKFDEVWPIDHDTWRGQALSIVEHGMNNHAETQLGDEHAVGCVTAVAYSPFFETNLGLGMISSHMSSDGANIAVITASGEVVTGQTSKLPFKKKDGKEAGRSRGQLPFRTDSVELRNLKLPFRTDSLVLPSEDSTL